MRSLIGKKFIKYVSLNVLGMLALSCYILADTFFVSNVLGSNGMAALNLAVPFYSLINGTGLMLGIGGGTLYAIQKANGDAKKSNSTFTNALTLGLGLGIIYMLVGIFFADELSVLLGAREGTLAYTTTYLRTILCFSPLFVINNTLIGFVRNDGSPKTAMAGMVIGSLSNVLLDYIFMLPFGMGMFGAAFATGFAPLISILCMGVYFFKKANCLRIVRCKFSIRRILKACHLGLNSFIIEIAFGLVLIIFNFKMLAIADVNGVAAYAIIANIAFVLNSLYTGIAQGMQPILSEAFGKKDRIAIRKTLLFGLVTAVVLFCLTYLTTSLFTMPIIGIFNTQGSEAVATIAARGFVLYFLGYGFAGFNIIIAQYFCATDRANRGFAIAILRSGACIVPLVFLLSAVMGIDGIWLSFVCSESITIAVSIVVLLLSKRKKSSGVHANEMGKNLDESTTEMSAQDTPQSALENDPKISAPNTVHEAVHISEKK